MRIVFIPIDNRPVCYDLAKDICAIDESIELFLPPQEYLGSLTKYADTEALINWLKNLPETDCMILSLDTLAYGGLIPSRRITDSYEQIKDRISQIKPLLKGKRVYAFSSIMRISNNNYNEEEKEYWKDWGKKIFRYSFETHKQGKSVKASIPKNILTDYLLTRERNHKINKLYLGWQKEEGLFDTLIFSKDDCAEYGFNVKEANELQKLGGAVKTGADEIPLTLLAKSLEKNVKIYPIFTEPDYKKCISNYEDISIEKSVLGQLELGGFSVVKSETAADVVLVVNNFREKQGEHVMGWGTDFYEGGFKFPNKPYAIADVRYANGADNYFVEEVLKTGVPEYGYSAWNTSANTLGSLLAGLKVKYQAKKYSEQAFKKLQTIRFLDDWAYQANVRGKISEPCDIKELMKPYEMRVFEFLKIKSKDISYTYPWNRKFEIRVNIE